MFRLEQLSIERSNYMIIEKKMIQMNRLLNYFFLLAPVPFVIIALCELQDVYSVMALEILVLMLGLLVVG